MLTVSPLSLFTSNDSGGMKKTLFTLSAEPINSGTCCKEKIYSNLNSGSRDGPSEQWSGKIIIKVKGDTH